MCVEALEKGNESWKKVFSARLEILKKDRDELKKNVKNNDEAVTLKELELIESKR